MTYFVNLLIAITAKTRENTIIGNIKTTITDFLDALKIKKYSFAFTMCVLLAAGILTYTTQTNILAPQIAH